MPIVKLQDADQYSEEIQRLDKRVREYTQAPGMTPYVKAAALHLPYLANMAEEHLYVMPSRKLPRKLKEMLAVAVSMVNGCSYCISAHSRVLNQMFHLSDAELVELTAAVAHISGLNRFETATISGNHEPLFPLRSEVDVPLLEEFRGHSVSCLPITRSWRTIEPGPLLGATPQEDPDVDGSYNREAVRSARGRRDLS